VVTRPRCYNLQLATCNCCSLSIPNPDLYQPLSFIVIRCQDRYKYKYRYYQFASGGGHGDSKLKTRCRVLRIVYKYHIPRAREVGQSYLVPNFHWYDVIDVMEFDVYSGTTGSRSNTTRIVAVQWSGDMDCNCGKEKLYLYFVNPFVE
jgi:hypothetical protein